MPSDRNTLQAAQTPAAYEAGAVHVWSFVAERTASALAALRATLSEEELRQAQTFHFPRDADRYVARHGLVRAALAELLGLEPAQLVFGRGTHGKPLLARSVHAADLHFNHSASGSAVVLAASAAHEVGVDIEDTRAAVDMQPIATQFFSRAEQAILARLGFSAVPFFTCWTAKEAVVKALGVGLRRRLDDFTTLTDGGSLLQDLQLQIDAHAATQCLCLRALTAPAQFRATLAVRLHPGERPPAVVEHAG